MLFNTYEKETDYSPEEVIYVKDENGNFVKLTVEDEEDADD
jgi:hypothetical protein